MTSFKSSTFFLPVEKSDTVACNEGREHLDEQRQFVAQAFTNSLQIAGKKKNANILGVFEKNWGIVLK